MATIDDLRDAVKAEFSGRLLGGNAVLPQSNFDVMAGFIGFLQFANEAGLQSVSKTLTPVTATGDCLDQWGQTFGVARLEASTAGGLVAISGTDGTTLPVGSTMTRCDGFEYVTTEAATINGGITTVPVVATDTGASGNFLAGGALTLGSVVSGIGANGISQGIVGGAEIECDDAYRARILSTIRNPCRTGTEADYQFWASLYAGVTRTCVNPNYAGPGTVAVYVMMDGSYPSGLPTATDLANIDDMIFGQGGLAPLGVVGQVLAPTLFPVDVNITGVGTTTAAEFAEITAAINEFLLDEFECGASTLCRADLEIALRNVLDAGCFSLASPTGNITIPAGSIPTLGVLTVA